MNVVFLGLSIGCFILFCLIWLIGLIGKGMSHNEKQALFGAALLTVLFALLGVYL